MRLTFGPTIVVLVGGPRTGKTRFFQRWTMLGSTHTEYIPSTNWTASSVLPENMDSIILVDTPGCPEYRSPDTSYSSNPNGIFWLADAVLNFGDWTRDDVEGGLSHEVPILHYSRDDTATFHYLVDFLRHK